MTKSAKKTGSPDEKKPASSADPEGRGKKIHHGSNPAPAFQKIHPSDLPTITLSSGPYLSHIREALETHCQRQLGRISRIFSAGAFDEPIVVTYDNDAMSEDKDPFGFERDRVKARLHAADAQNRMPVARREVTKSGYSCCKKAGDEDLLADKKVSPE